MADLHVGDIGTIIRMTIMDGTNIVDISSGSNFEIKLLHKDKSVSVHPASLTTDGTDGKMEIVTDAATLDEKYKMKAQGYFELPTWKGHTSKIDLPVDDNFEP